MTADLYPRPSRDRIAEQVHGQLPGAHHPEDPEPDPGPQDATDYVARFAQHLKGRMSALGWTNATLVDRSGYSGPTISRAINGISVALDIAAGLAEVLGSSLPAMLIPYQCGTCHGEPPPGFSCMECGTERRAS